MDKKRKLAQKELEEIAVNLNLSDDDDDPYQCSSDDDSDWVESEGEENESELSDDVSQIVDRTVLWSQILPNYVPRMKIPTNRNPEVLLQNVNSQSTEQDIFLKIFPKSAYMFITHCTNERIKILEKKTNKKFKSTDYSEIMLVTGVMIVMAYNSLPNQSCYWSQHPSMGNTTIKNAISRDRFKLLMSKLYFNLPEKPQNCSKIYYIEELLECFKHSFQKARTNAVFQSIDESMAKFKGRSSLKQYLPLKPVKRGIKLWVRSDSLTGYVYDLNVYSGKDTEILDGTLGERVVWKLASSINQKDVVLCFDRFFTSTLLMKSLPFACVGTCIGTRKNIPKVNSKLDRGQAEFLCADGGITFTRWQDTKQVLALSNCHGDKMTKVLRMQKNGEKAAVNCPEIIEFYNKYMGGVDLTDQLAGLYEFDRKSLKWWKKVFYKLLMIAAVNSYIIFNETRRKKGTLLNFLVNLAEQLIENGKKNSTVKRRSSTGRPSKRQRLFVNIGDHMPIVQKQRKRCFRCSSLKIDKRTTTICSTCQVGLCNKCFTPYHTK